LSGLQLAFILGGIVAACSMVLILSRDSFRRRIELQAFQLLTDASPAAAEITAASLQQLPGPVQRWLQAAGVVNRPAVTCVRLKQDGRLRLGAGKWWMPYTAQQYFSIDPPGFVWIVRASVLGIPLLSGFDELVKGRGRLQMRLAGGVKLVDATGSRIDQGELVRYLSEIIWFPAAALSSHIKWTAIDAVSASAAITVGDATASAVFHFNSEGLPCALSAQRFMGTQADARPEEWRTEASAHEEYQPWRGSSPVRLPSRARAGWSLTAGEFFYAEVRISEVEYNPSTIY
jgi:hypothetical protein